MSSETLLRVIELHSKIFCKKVGCSLLDVHNKMRTHLFHHRNLLEQTLLPNAAKKSVKRVRDNSNTILDTDKTLFISKSIQ